METLTREQAVNKLIDNEIADIKQGITNDDFSYINDVFREGFRGYNEYTLIDLKDELECQFDGDDFTVVEDKD